MSETAKDAPEIVGQGFCRNCRMDVNVIQGKKSTECERCGCPRVDR